MQIQASGMSAYDGRLAHAQRAGELSFGEQGTGRVILGQHPPLDPLVRTLLQELAGGEGLGEVVEGPVLERFAGCLSTRGVPDPDLLIRTSGEYRLSNFLLWQMAYTEFYFTDILWPDFREEQLIEAISVYQKRERRFGLTSDQVQKRA